jgi:hypothetical protein
LIKFAPRQHGSAAALILLEFSGGYLLPGVPPGRSDHADQDRSNKSECHDDRSRPELIGESHATLLTFVRVAWNDQTFSRLEETRLYRKMFLVLQSNC